MQPVLIALALSSPAALTPSSLRCEYLVNPIGIDEPAPRLSWIDSCSRRGAMQAAYRIVVSSTPAGAGDLWDSGRVESGESTQIPYAGKALTAGQPAFWKVTTWDDSGAQITSAETGRWEMGLPSAADWHAKWITLTQDDSDPLKIPSPLLRKQFSATKPIAKARVYASAKGLYKLFIDGKTVGDQLLSPGWTDYRKRVDYQTYDVTHLMNRGDNVIGLELGNGWYCGHVGGVGGDNYGRHPEGIAQLEITYRDGTTDEIVTDGSWKGTTGAIISNDLQMGETYDAQKAIDGWSTTKVSDANWQPVTTKDLNVPLNAQPSPPVQVLQELKAIKFVPQKEKGSYVFDMGQNMVGWVRLKVNGPAGTTVTLRFAEMLNPDDSVYTKNLRGARATDTYTLKGGGEETYEPTFTQHGFRYVEVTGYPGEPSLGAITGVVVGSNNPVVGQFSCSNPLVNQLQHNIFWGERGNYLSVPTDCPQRDERLGWMGDAQIFVRTATYNNDIAGFMTKWTLDQSDAQSPEGGYTDVTPRMGDQSDGAPAWGDAGVIVPYTIYKAYNDKRLLARRYDDMAKWIHYIDSVNPDHIWIKRSNNNFGDWLNVHDDTPRDVIATAYFAYSTDLVAKSAEALGKTEDAAKFHDLFRQIRDAFDSHFVAADGAIKADTQTDYVLALRFNLLPEAMRPIAAKKLVDHIMIDRKGHLSTGFVGVGYLNPTLTSIGRPDVAYTLLTNDTYPSWGYSIRQGATTIWERWDGWTQDKGFQDPGMNSFNHYSLGSVGEWMYGTVAGIDTDPTAPGYDKIVIHPVPGGGLTWANGSLQSPHGLIASGWKINKGIVTLNVTIPANTLAMIYVPTRDAGSVQESGSTAGQSPGVTSEGYRDGFAIYKVGGGVYQFTATAP